MSQINKIWDLFYKLRRHRNDSVQQRFASDAPKLDLEKLLDDKNKENLNCLKSRTRRPWPQVESYTPKLIVDFGEKLLSE